MYPGFQSDQTKIYIFTQNLLNLLILASLQRSSAKFL